MKFLITLFLLTTFSLVGFSQTLSTKDRGERTALSIRLANYTKETIKTLPVTMGSDIQSFSELELTEENDLALVKNAITTLLIIDNALGTELEDPSRTAVNTLTVSYKKHKDLYNKALKQLEKPQNKNQLLEFKDIWTGKNSN